MRYYSTQRPVMPGSFPKEGVQEIHNFDSRTYVPEIGREAAEAAVSEAIA